MTERNIINEIQNASNKASIKPSGKVWDQLEEKLDQIDIKPQRRIFNLQFLSIAAIMIFLIGAVISMIVQNGSSDQELTIQLEDLPTLELNSDTQLPNAGNAATIPALFDATAIFTSDKIIEEGKAGKKLVPNLKINNYGLG